MRQQGLTIPKSDLYVRLGRFVNRARERPKWFFGNTVSGKPSALYRDVGDGQSIYWEEWGRLMVSPRSTGTAAQAARLGQVGIVGVLT